MIRFAFTLAFLFVNLLTVQAQIEDEQHNALPPGPARISGYVTMDGAPVENAIVRLEGRLNEEPLQRDFKVYGHGEYTVYINKGSTKVVIKVLVDGEICESYQPQYYSEGSVQRKNFDLAED